MSTNRMILMGLLGLAASAWPVAGLSAAEPLQPADWLRRVTDLDRLSTPPRGERLLVARPTAAPPDADGWSGKTRLTGPGLIVRLVCARPEGRMRLVLDQRPPLELALHDVFAGTAPPFSPGCGGCDDGGCLTLFPLGFASECEISFDTPDLPWQLEWLRLPPGQTCATMPPVLPADAAQAAEELAGLLRDGLGDAQLFGNRHSRPEGAEVTLKRGEKTEWPITGAGIIRALYLAPSDRQTPRELYALHRCILRIYFDGRESPAVETPLTAFFGSGFELSPYQGLLLGTDRAAPIPMPDKRFGEDRVLYCFYPMPFTDGARIEIENLNTTGRPISFFLYLRVETAVPPDDALRFHARYRRLDTRTSREVQFATLPGPGRFIGLSILFDTPDEAHWWDARLLLRPDADRASAAGPLWAELGVRDGRTPRHSPLSSLLRPAAQGKSSGHRLRTTDALEYFDSLAVGLAEPPADAFCGAVLYWYGPADARLALRRLRAEDLEVPGLRIPGAVEVETALRGSDWGQLLLEKNAGGVEFSGGRAAHITTTEPVTLVLRSAAERRVRLRLRVHPRRAFEQIEFSTADGVPLGAAHYDRGAEGLYDIGEVSLPPGETRLIVRCSRPAVLDCLILEDL